MRTRVTISAVSVWLVLLVTQVYAGAGWTEYVSVAELTATSQEHFLTRLEVRENPSGCKNKVMFYLEYSTRGAEQMFNSLLAALHSGKKVRVFVTGNCELNGYSEISAVGILQ